MSTTADDKYQFEWISWGAARDLEEDAKSVALLGLGGWVNDESLHAFAADYLEPLRPIIMAAGKYLTDEDIQLTGRQHQELPEGALRVSRKDGGALCTLGGGKEYTVATFAGSFRAWGDFVAAAWNTHNEASGDSKRFSYMDFYY